MGSQAYIYNEKRENRDECISVVPSASVPENSSSSLAVPASEHTGGVSFSVRCSGDGDVYLWRMPVGKHTAGILITVSAAVVKKAVEAARRIFAGVVKILKITMAVRRPACLRL